MDGSGSGSASGKVILVGEHAVVYGVPAIAVGIDRGARARARRKPDRGPSELELRVASGSPLRAVEGEGSEPIATAFTALVASLREARLVGSVAVDVEADLPAGAGLGCSAAIGVAIARACADLSGDEARRHAMAWERVFHGNPSGVDAAVAALGGALVFSRETEGGERHGASIEPLHLGAPIVLAVGHSGLASSTRSMVESVARQRERQPALVQKTFDGIAAIAGNARLAIEAGDLVALGKLLDLNQMLLAGLLLSTQEIEAMCASARREGALGAKLTGAGGGGCVVALAETRASAEAILAAWNRDGFEGFVSEVAPSLARGARPVVALGGRP